MNVMQSSLTTNDPLTCVIFRGDGSAAVIT